MPANLPPEYHEAKDRYEDATDPDEELNALRDMLSNLPKHKGTDKIQARLRRKISETKEKKRAQQKKQKKQKEGRSISIERQGSGQIYVYGPPNSGKTTILNELTSLDRKTGDYPHTTREPYPGMMKYENVDIQLVDFPPLTPDYIPAWVNPLLRGADGLCHIVDAGSESCLEDLEESLEILEEEKIIPSWQESRLPPEDSGYMVKPTLLVANKMDVEGAEERIEIVRELYGEDFDPLPVSAKEGKNLDRVREGIWKLLGKIRIYSRPKGEDPDWEKPYTIPEGSTVQDFAEAVHREIAGNLQYARIWGNDQLHDGQRIQRDHVLSDEDQVQLCME